MGLIPAKAIITENPPEKYRDSIREEFKNIADDVSLDVDFEEDSYVIHEKIRKTDFGRKPPIILELQGKEI